MLCRVCHENHVCFVQPKIISNLEYPKRTITIHPRLTYHIATSNLICSVNQATGFFMKCNTELKWVKN